LVHSTEHGELAFDVAEDEIGPRHPRRRALGPSILLLHRQPLALLFIEIELRDGGGLGGPYRRADP
jgi:hypothetical protein